MSLLCDVVECISRAATSALFTSLRDPYIKDGYISHVHHCAGCGARCLCITVALNTDIDTPFVTVRATEGKVIIGPGF